MNRITENHRPSRSRPLALCIILLALSACAATPDRISETQRPHSAIVTGAYDVGLF